MARAALACPLPGKAVRLLVGQAVTRHEPGQILDAELTPFTYPTLVGIVGPLSAIFQVVHVMAEPRQAQDVLEVLPRYPPLPPPEDTAR